MRTRCQLRQPYKSDSQNHLRHLSTRGCWKSRWKHQRLPSCLEFVQKIWKHMRPHPLKAKAEAGPATAMLRWMRSCNFSVWHWNATMETGKWKLKPKGLGEIDTVYIYIYDHICHVYIYIYVCFLVYVCLRHEGPSQTNLYICWKWCEIRLCGVAFKNGFRRKHLEDDWCWNLMWEKLLVVLDSCIFYKCKASRGCLWLPHRLECTPWMNIQEPQKHWRWTLRISIGAVQCWKESPSLDSLSEDWTLDQHNYL